MTQYATEVTGHSFQISIRKNTERKQFEPNPIMYTNNIAVIKA